MTEFDSTPQPGDSIDALLAQLGHKEALVRSESEAYLAWLEQFTASHGHIYSTCFSTPLIMALRRPTLNLLVTRKPS